MFKLVISDNEGSTTVVPLVRDEITIGRKEGNTIRLTERNVSRRHAQLRRVNGGYQISDLDSYNGVIVNGQAVKGLSQIGAGDQIQIGDYTISVEREVDAVVAPVTDDAKTQIAPMPRPALPARLVMLGQPTPGAEFSLAPSGTVRLGRSEEAEIALNHRSVSREHAEIRREGDGYVLTDLASANGVTLNGQTSHSAVLKSGDIIELGQVLLRYVEAGEQYFFDPAEAARHRSSRGMSRNNLIMGGVIAVSVAVIGAVLLSSSQDPPAPEVATPLAPEPTSPVPTAAAAAAAAPAEQHQKHEQALADCRSALVGGRFAEAVAHANLALEAEPGSASASECRSSASARLDEEQTFVRGTSALQAGDAEGAYREFAKLGDQSPYRARPEVGQAIEQVGVTRNARARQLLGSNRPEAGRVAASVVSFPEMPELLRAEARALQAESRKPAPASEPVAHAAAPASRPSAGSSSRPRTAAPAAAPAPASSGNAMQAASACLARGDNACVIQALQGKAQSAQELGLLIETYRAMGNSAQAQRHMAVYVQRYPTAKRADAYKKMLERK